MKLNEEQCSKMLIIDVLELLLLLLRYEHTDKRKKKMKFLSFFFLYCYRCINKPNDVVKMNKNDIMNTFDTGSVLKEK